ncbi:MAG: 16S rRNA (adenine(1408)-N(1))-methyltransferase [Chloroflexi bacterium]|nr:MAG: 16S rRNA (adenine(1408)-N(1))-methyltransferase [Chloroflexota bacterium]
MRVVTGKSSVEVSAREFRARAAGYDALWLDIGTGDGALPYRLAGSFPDVLCAGLDPNVEGMAENAHRAGRKPARGGRANCVYVAASVEEPPGALAGAAQAITINFPWAALLAIVLGESDGGTLTGLGAFAAEDCVAQLLVNEVTDLPGVPSVAPEMLRERVGPNLAAAGFVIESCEWLEREAQVRSRWGGRLIRGSGRRVVRLRALRGTPPARALALVEAVSD